MLICLEEKERLSILSQDIEINIENERKKERENDFSLAITDQEVILLNGSKLYSFSRFPLPLSSSLPYSPPHTLSHSLTLQQALPAMIKPITHISAGIHFVVFSTENEIWSYGMNQINPEKSLAERREPSLELVTDTIDSNISAISTGYYHVLIVDKNGHCYSFGRGSSGQLGLGNRFIWVSSPQQILSLDQLVVIAVSAASEHSLFLTLGGSVLSCGSCSFDRLGKGENTELTHLTHLDDCLVPTLVDDLEGVGFDPLNHSFDGIKCVSSSVWHNVVVTHSTNDVYTWGYSKFGQFGR